MSRSDSDDTQSNSSSSSSAWSGSVRWSFRKKAQDQSTRSGHSPAQVEGYSRRRHNGRYNVAEGPHIPPQLLPKLEKLNRHLTNTAPVRAGDHFHQDKGRRPRPPASSSDRSHGRGQPSYPAVDHQSDLSHLYGDRPSVGASACRSEPGSSLAASEIIHRQQRQQRQLWLERTWEAQQAEEEQARAQRSRIAKMSAPQPRSQPESPPSQGNQRSYGPRPLVEEFPHHHGDARHFTGSIYSGARSPTASAHAGETHGRFGYNSGDTGHPERYTVEEAVAPMPSKPDYRRKHVLKSYGPSEPWTSRGWGG